MKKEWLDIIFKEEAIISSDKKWLETKFWALLASVIFTLFTYTFGLLRAKLLKDCVFQGVEFSSFSLALLTCFWIFLVFVRICYFTRSSNRIKNIKILIAFLYFIVLFLVIVVSLHTYVFFYIKDHFGLINYPIWFLLFPIFVLAALIIQVINGIISPVEFQSLQAHYLAKKRASNKFSVSTFLFTCSLICLIGVYIFLYYKHNTNLYGLYSDFKLCFLVLLLACLTAEAFNTRWTIDNLPDLRELKFKLISGRIENDKEIIGKYEELFLGKDALSWLKDKCLREKDTIRETLKHIDHIKKEISQIETKKQITNEEVEWIKTKIEGVKSSMQYKKEDLEENIYIDILNLDKREVEEYKEFLSQEITPLISDIEKEIENLIGEFNKVEPLLKNKLK